VIPAAIDAIFGNPQLRTNYSNCVIVVRHGFNSNHKPFIKLSNQLRGRFAGAAIDNVDYVWTRPIIENGVKLALDILQVYEDSQPLCLIGHSMGGLVCRVANVALTRAVEFDRYIAAQSIAGGPSYLSPVKKLMTGLRRREVSGLVTLATPNSATLTYGQLASWMKLSTAATTLGFPNRTASFLDLTTDRLFRVLQNFRVNTPTLSVSGSAHNRFAKKRPALGALVGLAGKLALPNDGLVEDRSVDLKASILPNEICHMGTSKYLHLREYSDCTDVTHSSIYDEAAVYEALDAFIERIL
jgi:pimeloyl-ACP methyl ester carboxylesterase